MAVGQETAEKVNNESVSQSSPAPVAVSSSSAAPRSKATPVVPYVPRFRRVDGSGAENSDTPPVKSDQRKVTNAELRAKREASSDAIAAVTKVTVVATTNSVLRPAVPAGQPPPPEEQPKSEPVPPPPPAVEYQNPNWTDRIVPNGVGRADSDDRWEKGRDLSELSERPTSWNLMRSTPRATTATSDAVPPAAREVIYLAEKELQFTTVSPTFDNIIEVRWCGVSRMIDFRRMI
jgi:hypothetical protein